MTQRVEHHDHSVDHNGKENFLASKFSERECQEKQNEYNGKTVKPYLLIGIVNGPSVGHCCNLKGSAPDVAIYSRNNVIFFL